MKNGNQKMIQLRTRYFEYSQIPMFLEPGEVCQLFGITRQTLKNWENDLGLPMEHITASYMYCRKNRLMEWIENGYKPLPESKYPVEELPGLRVV
jgi:DNA-binding XRE family transcriptional regulator